MIMRKWIAIAAVFGLGSMLVLLVPVGGGLVAEPETRSSPPINRLDMSAFSDAPLNTNLNLLFIHHSCGGQLFAAPGTDSGTNCIYASHPNGGNLRPLLEQSGYLVHEASYGSQIGDATDVFDWLPKFRGQMDEILRCDQQDARYTDDRRNQVVVFKSCYPNNAFRAEGVPPGNPTGPDLTVWNAKATYSALLDEFRKHPEVLFVCVTAPPQAPKSSPQPLWKQLAKKVLGRTDGLAWSGPLARSFNHWLFDTNGWLKEYSLKNVVVFDYYDILTGNGASDFSVYPTGDGYDSHPSRTGNEKAAHAFVPFLDQAVRRAGLAN